MEAVKFDFPSITGSEAEGLKAYHDACLAAWDAARSPNEVALEVFALAERWPFLRDEGYALRAMGEVWRNAQGHALGDGIVRPPQQEPPETLPEQTGWEF